MKKYKLLKFGRCYINQRGDFVIGLARGNKKYGYYFIGSHANPSVLLGHFWLETRVVLNDGNWKEITPEMFQCASHFHSQGQMVNIKKLSEWRR